MTRAVTPGGREVISHAAEVAKTTLAQTAFAAFALRASDQCIGTMAAALFSDPNGNVGMPNTRESPGQQEARRGRMVDVLLSVKCHVATAADPRGMFGPGNLGGVVNKMIVTHAVAVLETFMENAAGPFEALLGPYLAKKGGQLARSFGGKCRDLKCAGVADLSGLHGYAEADLLAQVRHVIVHRNGEVDCKFLAAAKASQSPLARGLEALSVGDQVSIPIDDFILLALRGSLEFVSAAARALSRKAACGTRQSS